MKQKWSFIKVVPALLIPLVLMGCGSNIFSGLVSSKLADDPVSKLDRASTPEEYQSIINDLEITIASGTAAEVQTAQALKGEAQLGKLGISAVDIFADLASLANATSSTASGNIFDLITIGDNITIAELQLAAAALNSANALSGTSNVRISPQSSTVPSLNADAQMTRGIANALVTIKIVKTVFTVGNDGTLTPKVSGNKSFQNLEALITPVSVLVHANAAINGFSAAGAFTADQLAEATKVKTASVEIDALYTEAAKTNSTYTFNSVTYAVGSADTNRDTNIDDALTAIFQSITS